MGDVVQFPVRRARRGGVFCEPLGIFFPALLRQVVTATAEDLKTVGLEDDPDVAPGTWTYYALGEANQAIGTSVLTEVNCINPDDRIESIVIRHHPSLEHAHGYLDACGDKFLADETGDDFDETGDDFDGSGIFETDEAIFTITPIATNSSWPGPLVFNLAEVPADNIAGRSSWAHIVAPGGVVLEGKSFGF